ncbi:MAG: DNA translocase FtsK [Hydrogenoanaerobacterium sp.]
MAKQSTAYKKKQTPKAQRPQKTIEQNAAYEAKSRWHKQLYALSLFAAGIFIFAVCVVEGKHFWTSMHRAMFGLFGWCAFLVPVAFVAIAVLTTMEKCSLKHKLWQSAVLIALLCGVTHVFAMPGFEAKGFTKTIVLLFESGTKLLGGGVFAGFFGVPFLALFGDIGAKFTLILLIFVFLMVITRTTLHDFMKKAYKPVQKIGEVYNERAEEKRSAEGARFNIDVPLSAEVMPQHPVQSEKATLEYTDSIKLAKESLPLDDEPKQQKNMFGFAKKQAEQPPAAEVQCGGQASAAATLGIDEIVNKAMGLEANAFKPVYISDEDAEAGVISSPDDGKFHLSPDAQAHIDEEFAADEEALPPLVADEFDVAPLNDLPPEPNDAYAMLQRALAEEPEDIFITAQENNDEIIPPIADGTQEEENAEAAQEDDLVKDCVEGRFKAKFTQNDGKENFNAYIFPPISLLKETKSDISDDVPEELKANAQRLVDTLNSFGVQTRIIDICRGPAVTRYELQPSAGVKISKITGLSDDIALNLATAGVRIEAPIPNKAAVGIEVPNKTVSIVGIRELIDSDVFMDAQSKLTVALGKDISGNIATADIGKMPHMLIAGATGSGKSVCINSIIISLLYKATPDEVRLLMIDPKVVELGGYNGIPHLLVPVVTDPRKAAGALNWAVSEMLGRYKIFADCSVRDLKSYNKLAAKSDNSLAPMPEIVIIIDELADLMMAAPNEVEDAICRLAQMARAAGMHLVIATQRPSVDVITGVIKANIPSRIAFAVSSQVDSRTILDGGGAEKLLGRGDMLFLPVGVSKPTRVQGCFVSDREVEKVVKFVKDGKNSEYDENIMNEIERQAVLEKGKSSGDGGGFEAEDEMVAKAIELVIEMGQCSTSLLQRKLKLGYARAARIVDEMEERGIVGTFEGSKPRAVLMTRQQWIEMKMSTSENT